MNINSSDVSSTVSSNSLATCEPLGKGIEFEPIAARVMQPGVTEPPVGECRASPSERAQGLLRGLMLILAHHSAPQMVLDDFRRQATTYLTVESESVFFKRAKYLTVAPMAKYLRCEPPKQPDADFVATGHWKRWSHGRFRVFSRRNTHLWYSFLQGKRAALPLSDELVLTTYEEHRISMGREDPIDDETLEIIMKELEPVLEKVQRQLIRRYNTNRQITFEDHMGDQWFVSDRETRHKASSRACYEASRAKGGQLGHLVTLCPGVQTMNPSNRTEVRKLPELARMVYHPVALVRGLVRYNVLIEEYDYRDGEVLWYDAIKKEAVKFTGGTVCRATIQAVLEPLKVRVISKGNAVPYYVSKPLQVALHDTLREMSCFRLIGRPLCPTDLFDLAENRSIIGTGQYEWFSIDYSAATDRLSAKLSARILGRLLEGQNEELTEIWRSVLAPHWCRYPYPYSESVKPIQQQNGQLMGSILSFPILCLANLGLYLGNLREDSRPLRDKLKGVLVNGDDMLYVARSSMWKQHVELGDAVGLTMSPGKAYHHRVYANANSACYHYDLYNRRSTPYYVPFLNVGLYFGQSKVLGGDELETEKSLVSTITRLVDGSLPGKQADVFRGFMSRHTKAIQSECSDNRHGMRNLFIPVEMGGMGVTPIPGVAVGITYRQQVTAYTRLWSSPHHWPGHGVTMPSVKELTNVVRAPWIEARSSASGRSCLARICSEVTSLSWKRCLEGFHVSSVRIPEYRYPEGITRWSNQSNFSRPMKDMWNDSKKEWFSDMDDLCDREMDRIMSYFQ